MLFANSSVYFLAHVSLERAFAVLRPIRHRVTNSRIYIYSIVIVWVVGLVFFGFTTLSFHLSEVKGKYVFVVIICTSYLSIRTRLRARSSATLDNQKQGSREHNLRLARTLYITIASSLVFWYLVLSSTQREDSVRAAFLHHSFFGWWMPCLWQILW